MALTSVPDEFFLNNSRIQSQGPPPPRNYRSFFNWAYTKQELSPGYRDFMFHESDFVSGIGGAESNRPLEKGNYFEELIRDLLIKWPKIPLKVWPLLQTNLRDQNG
jgi:hypothetical protein